MGELQLKDTHGKRSSSMSFALRWKHENVRLIILSAMISIAMTFMFLVLLYGTADKHVSVVLNGRETIVSTKQWVLQRLLDEQAITVGTYDKVSMPLSGGIKDGDRVVIDQAVPLIVKADGKAKTLYTTERTVQAAIDQANISVRSQDKVVPTLTDRLSPNMVITITRIDKKYSETAYPVPFSIVKKEDPKLELGKQKLVQNGKQGTVVKRYESVFADGVLVSQTLVEKLNQDAAVDKIVTVGTKKPDVMMLSANSSGTWTKRGITFSASKILKNVTLTAYSAGVASTGKGVNHPEYGITASGARVKEGRTIAVDPRVIPIGWWVYIEGIGFRRAEDTGSAIKGKKIDVYYNSESYADRFGLKRGYTVYVLGPKKPESL
ncbi:3D domain-containing protein [Paenibacillus sp. R14(2021)]|uniref:3D domain-containing protein n=1 Tax=Paenibacillus sp. R14(2021) TaxID=2859228 RepID=UPI001C612F8C|nr:3D domain-containing protein [Paenibacillus sp. R14(2021)]